MELNNESKMMGVSEYKLYEIGDALNVTENGLAFDYDIIYDGDVPPP
ncbi:hypothetical protein Pan97_28660 [Bremerella volcania]|uniref:Uncharacterized protein n=1 Tax=Bremerella volcania TaxID=2527984 RepID=A0A518C9F5_9BACT|nr:hypothetical protein [Bremerella volcania]QDU75824.1 hypothetical protein Pan97_28660 [Bremerella volcania]